MNTEHLTSHPLNQMETYLLGLKKCNYTLPDWQWQWQWQTHTNTNIHAHTHTHTHSLFLVATLLCKGKEWVTLLDCGNSQLCWTSTVCIFWTQDAIVFSVPQVQGSKCDPCKCSTVYLYNMCTQHMLFRLNNLLLHYNEQEVNIGVCVYNS